MSTESKTSKVQDLIDLTEPERLMKRKHDIDPASPLTSSLHNTTTPTPTTPHTTPSISKRSLKLDLQVKCVDFIYTLFILLFIVLFILLFILYNKMRLTNDYKTS